MFNRLVDALPWPVEHSLARRSQSRQGFLKSFVDLFTLSLADAAFLTNWSLFGRAGLEIGMGDDEAVQWFINDSQCGMEGRRPCMSPRLPALCLGHSTEL